jgi:hypothetical protein
MDATPGALPPPDWVWRGELFNKPLGKTGRKSVGCSILAMEQDSAGDVFAQLPARMDITK